ncbi:hypothetical protein FACS1894137_16020 [Spirochaetia bacterium]|nr:hypothetical protein FACS1894137_16020 [Spirochaetia bacterium]
MEQGIVDSLSYITVARTLRKYYPSPATRLPAAVPVIKKPRKKAARLPLALKPGEKERLEEMVNAKEEPPRWAAWQTLRAEVLLHLARTPSLTKRQAADLCHCSPTLIDNVTRQYESDGLERVLTQQRGTWTGEKKADADRGAIDQGTAEPGSFTIHPPKRMPRVSPAVPAIKNLPGNGIKLIGPEAESKRGQKPKILDRRS